MPKEFIVNAEKVANAGSLSTIKVIPFNQKSEWELVAKYNIGKKK